MQLVFRVNGMLLAVLAIFMLVPMAVDLSNGDAGWQAFATSSFLALFFGLSLYLANHKTKESLSLRQIYILTLSIWVTLPAFAALPFYLLPDEIGLSNAVFEAVSGLTTTGATVLSGLDNMSHGILLWRSILEWIGGLGIVVMAMAIFPILRVGGMQLFKTESSDRSDKMFPKTRYVALTMAVVYFLLTLACAISYHAAGMNGFDALCHAMTTASTGGFSTHDKSIAYFQSANIEIVATIFMFLGGVPLLLYYALLAKRSANKILLSQTKFYVLFILGWIVVIALWLMAQETYEFESALRYSSFNIISIITGTGYSSTNYALWGSFPVLMIYFLTIAGGCTGSTSGGMKIFRIQIILKTLVNDFKKLVSPNGVFSFHIGNVRVNEDAVTSVKVFFILFIFSFVVVATSISFFGLDFLTAMSATAASLSNVGPGLGDVIGPSGNYSSLPEAVKYILAFAMIVGRLEFMTFFVLTGRLFWEG